jgi:hypothetical protein
MHGHHSTRSLKRLYLRYNRLYFDNELPRYASRKLTDVSAAGVLNSWHTPMFLTSRRSGQRTDHGS